MDLSGILDLLETLFDGGLAEGSIVVVAWLANQAYAWLGAGFSTDWKKVVVLVASVAIAILQDPFNLGEFSLEPQYLGLLAAQSVGMFKAAQIVYDRIFAKMAAA